MKTEHELNRSFDVRHQTSIGVILAVFAFVACGDMPSEVGSVPDGPLQMALVSGGGQEVTVTDTLPSDIVVKVTKGGQPLTDQLVDWRVLSDNCGEPFVTTTRTDSNGTTGNRLVAGTRAWTRPDGPDVCGMEVRYALVVSDTVQARVDTTVNYLVLPGVAVEDFDTYEVTGDGSVTLPPGIHDQYDNPIPYSLEPNCCAHMRDTSFVDGDARTLVVDSAGSGIVRVMVSDTVADAAALETDSGGGITVDFHAYSGG